MKKLPHELRLFFTALQFLTRVPVPAWVGFEPAWLQQSVRYFPLVGLFVGCVAAVVMGAAHELLPNAIAAGLSIAATVLLTGAFHEDGFADTCDGLGGAVDRVRALAIMKDSRIGSYGSVGLILMLGLKAATLTEWLHASLSHALLLTVWTHMASRLAPLWIMRALPYAGDAEHAKAKPLATGIGKGGLLFAAGCVVLLSALVLGFAPDLALPLVWAVAVAALVCWRLQAWLKRRLGGFTGDTLGATQQLVELALLITTLAVWNFGLRQ
ncbi:MAG TPA: adenosylcobinamide-GDP ribazoletransferase [Burkholderiaceae bacterium]|jgi:adenosylcobinamide-GDP ribazoletransferase